MRIGLAGAGRIGARHAGALRRLPDVGLLLIADADPRRAEHLAAHLAARPLAPAPASAMASQANAARPDGLARPPDGASGATVGPGAGPSRAAGAGAGPWDGGSSGGGRPQDAVSVGAAPDAAVGVFWDGGPAGTFSAGAAPGGCADVVAVASVEELFGRVDALVVAAATGAHAPLVRRAIAERIPVFCEKPLAADLDGTFQIVAAADAASVPVQVGFQRRFDAGYAAAREAVASGRLGWLHTVRSCGFDPAPPPPGYVPGSGGLFRDCLIHDLDSIRYVTGREVARVMAVGANLGAAVFRECGDVDTGAALLVLDDGALATVAATRYNAAGYDVRLELFGSEGSVAAGLDARTPLTALPAAAAPADPYTGFLDRFADAYDAELRAFVRVAAGELANPCPPADALEAFYLAEACELARREGRAVDPAEVRR
ncbi:Gfo/Idh/MocA family protein [Actinomadura parmotrematis]|uniref:Gfo/Idh/MocA family oxidoreductase n=1 Tax=Actinomadura parmotrematis TaxID=2864039 RepID=A0ABS7FQE4_9ACTN|nr:Gfo/Idh/MocA family oxidoreductase [Actinomadura parmotrematis]MBW8482531.1 Gfo/Idh/MocA family oxidoreductase [Actinomadura parmotrematis]